jgi:hypothetical protein
MSSSQSPGDNPYAATQPILATAVHGLEVLADGGLSLGYDITVEDLIEFSVFHHFRSASGRKQRGCVLALFIVAIGITLIVLIPALIASVVTKDLPTRLVVIVFGIVLASSMVFLIFRQKHNLRRAVARLYAEGSTETLIGWHRMILTSENMHVQSGFITTKMRWSAFQRVVRAPQLVCCYYSAVHAVIVPTRAFADEAEIQRFIDTVNGFLQPLRSRHAPS